MTDDILARFDEIDADIRRDMSERRQAAGLIASDRNPDEFARAGRLADKHGAPVGVVADSLPDYERQDREQAFGALGLAHPQLAPLLADQRWRTLAQDDAEGVGRLASALRSKPERQRTLLSKSFESLFGPLLQNDTGQALLRNLDDTSDMLSTATRGTLKALGEVSAEASRDVQTGGGGATARGIALGVVDPRESERQIAAARFEAERVRLAGEAAAARDQAGAIQESYGDGTPGYYAMGVARSVPIMAAAAVTRSPAVGALLIGGTTAAEQRSSALAGGATRTEATASGLAHGTFEGTLDAVTLGVSRYGLGPVRDELVKRFGASTASKLLARATATAPGRLATAAATGAATETPTTLAQMASDELILGTDYTSADYLRGVRDSVVQGGAVSGGLYAVTSPLRSYGDAGLTRALTSADDLADLQAVTAAAAESKLGQRSPEDVAAIAEALASGERVYLAADDAKVLFQNDPGLLADLVGGNDALTEQLATGDVSIPMAAWVSRVARLPNVDEIMRHARMDPDGISAAEMERLDAEAAQFAPDTADAADRAAPGAPDSRQQIADDVLGQLMATERYTPAQAEAQAKFFAAAMSRAATRAGQDPMALYQRYMAGIRSESSRPDPRATRPFAGSARLDALIESVRTGIEPNQGEVFGPSLTRWLADQGGVQDQTGELRAFDARRLRPGLVNRQGLPLDRARELAAEAGYLPADSTVADFLDLIDRDLRTNDVRSEQQANAGRMSFEQERRQFMDAFDSNPELRGMPREELAKLTNQQIAERLFGSTLQQSAVPQESEIDRLRARVAELENELRTDRLTGMRNQRAFEEDEALGWETVAAADMDGLKRLNDAIGHEHADTVLRALGGVLLSAETDGVRFYRRSGDEFAARFEDPAAAQRIMRELQQRLENVAIDLDVADAAGNIRQLTYEGIGLTYGTGNDYQSADTAANASKRERLAAGIREDARAGGDSRRLQPRAGGEGGRDAHQGQAPAVGRGLFARAFDSVRALFQQPTGSGPRGQINIYPDRRMSIALFETADKTTFIHESAHFFFEVYRDLAADPNATAEIADDFAELLKWFGVDNVDAITDDHLEQFARGFEAYVGEGKAPSPELRGVFAKFSAWVLGVYRSLRGLNVELTDEVRGVFDRMLASEEEIEAAQVRQGMVPMALDVSEARALGLTDRQFDEYRRLAEDATEEARLSVFEKTLGALQRERNAWWKEERAAVREEIANRYEETPAVRAMRVLSGRKTVNGIELEPPLAGLKLDRAAVVAGWGDAYLNRLGRTYAKSGGVHPDEAAALLGYASGDDLLRALANAPDLIARVDAEADAVMRERHGDPMTDGTLPEKAMDAVHGSKRVKLLERELEILASLSNQPAPNRRMLKAMAERSIAGKTPRQLRPNDYLVAERRAAREALKSAARQDFADAMVAKRRQAMNVALYSAARAAQQQFETDLAYLRRMTTDGRRARLGKAGASYLDQVDGLLEAIELKPASGPEVQRRQRLVDWVHAQEAAGNPVNVPIKLLADAGLTNVRDMTHEDIRGVVDTIRQIEHLAKTKTRLMLNGLERDREEVDAEMAASVLAAHTLQPERTGDETFGEHVRERLTDVDLDRLLPTNLARELDGYEADGAVWRNIILPIREAMYQRVIPAMHAMQEAVAGIYAKHYAPEELRRLNSPVWREAVGDHWSKGRILTLAMNWGSDGNREAILTQARSRLTEAQAVELLRTLDARDWAFVQDMVDKVNSYWPEIAETQRRRTGLVPEKVDGKPFVITNAAGETITVRGGYFPLKYDASRSGFGATADEIEDAFNDLRIGRTAKAATKHGHTIERVGSGGKTVDLGLDNATAHMRMVIRDLYLGDAVNYVAAVLKGGDFTKAAIGAGKRQHLEALNLWLKDVATGEIGPSKLQEMVIRFVRQNTTAAVLTYKASSALLQLTGLVQTGSVIGNRATLRGLTRLMSKSWLGPNSIWNDIRERSPYMRERFGQIADAVEVIQSQRDGRLKSAHSAMIRWGYVPMARIQMIADAVTWLAGEAVGLKKFDGDADMARAFADDLVIRAQSPDGFIDKSAIGRGTFGVKMRQSEFVRATTMLMSYMIAKGNIMREKYQQTEFTKPAQVLKFSVDMVQLFAVESIAMALLRNGLPDDEEDDGIADDWAAYVAKEVSLGSIATIPMLSQLATEGRGYTAQGVMERAWSQSKDGSDRWIDDELNRNDLKALVSVSGLATGLPSSQINTTADALWRVHDGEDVSPLDYVVKAEKPRE